MPTGPQEINVSPHAGFDAMVLGLPAVGGAAFSSPVAEHGVDDRWFTVDLRLREYNAVDDRVETLTRVALCVREPGESQPGGWTVSAWGLRAATGSEIQLMARLCLAAYAAYRDEEMETPAELSAVRLGEATAGIALPGDVDGIPVYATGGHQDWDDEMWFEVGDPGRGDGASPLTTVVTLCGWYDHDGKPQAEGRYQAEIRSRVPTAAQVADAARRAMAGYREHGSDGYVVVDLS